jgi:Secretion system C-terminal sorting domain
MQFDVYEKELIMKLTTSILSICFASVLSVFPSVAQPPDTLWTRTFGGEEADYGHEARQTPDGGFIVVGSTHSFGAGYNDLLLVKTDPDGTEIWSQTFGGYNYDIGYSVQLVPGGGYIVSGRSASFDGGDYRAWLIRTDSDGNEIWSNTYGSSHEDAKCVQPTADGGFLLAGYTFPYQAGSSSLYVVKTDSMGNEQWWDFYGRSAYHLEYTECLRPTADGGHIAIGTSDHLLGGGDSDMMVVKLDSLGDEQWTRYYGRNDDDFGAGIQQTNDGGYILAGNTRPIGQGDSSVLLMKLDPNGNEVWSNSEIDGRAEGICLSSSGEYVLAGTRDSDVWLCKADINGNEFWSHTVGGPNNDYGYSINVTDDGGYIVAGKTFSYGAGEQDFYLIRFAGSEEPAPVTFTISPMNTEIGPNGGLVTYGVELTNNTASLFSDLTYWTIAISPNGNPIGPLFMQNFTMRPFQEIAVPLVSQDIPAFAPAGVYTHISNVGIYPDDSLSDEFQFTKLGNSNSTTHSDTDWSVTGIDLSANSQVESKTDQHLSLDFKIVRVYPNPFNASTAISISLPNATDLSVIVYNVMGQVVATLADGHRNAGHHTITFDASNLTTGLYFVRVTIPGHFNEVQKVMLLR